MNDGGLPTHATASPATTGEIRQGVAQIQRRWWLHIALFAATLVSTTVTAIGSPPSILRGLSYGAPLMAILLCHEMGHYVMCLRYRVPATLPYFLPLPFVSIFGTLGAVIRMKGPVYGRKALFDIGIAGPLAGLVVAIPVTFIGLKLSEVRLADQMPPGTMTLGEPLLFAWLGRLALGELPAQADTLLHPLAFAGWAGFFVTALNLLPIGQLDGGHVAHSLFPGRSKIISWVALGGLGLAALRFPGWGLLAVIILMLGVKHPPTGPHEELGPARFWIGILGFLIFFLTFTPEPFGRLP